MIFVTVGSQIPFDRLIRAVDEWARLHSKTEVFAQIANGTYLPQHIGFTYFMKPTEFASSIQAASVIVAHAGMGTIISALELGKQVVVMPRRASLHETRNDHQVATAKHFGTQGRIIVANDEHELPSRLDYASTLRQSDCIDSQASPQLLATIRVFLEGKGSRANLADPVSSHNLDPDLSTVSPTMHSRSLTARRNSQ
jgi:UDP-N-acetylglucosamine transferase subunit ALG13